MQGRPPESRLLEWTGRRQGVPPHLSPVSIHCGFGGRELYRTRDGLYAVEPGRMLVLDAGQTVSTHVRPEEASAGVSVLFARALVSGVRRALALREEALLDEPFAAGPPPAVAERTHALETAVAVPLRALRATVPGDPRWEERLHDLLEAVLRLAAAAARTRERVPAVRPSTRAELHRRLQRARDYLHAAFEQGVTLAELGRVAALSPPPAAAAVPGHLRRDAPAVRAPPAYGAGRPSPPGDGPARGDGSRGRGLRQLRLL